MDELPKPTKIKFNEDEGYFEYLIYSEEHKVTLRTRIKLNKTEFQPQDYKLLRDFFDVIIKKQSEPIVFKKL